MVGNFPKLTERLFKNGVAEEDINELKGDIQSDSPDLEKKEFGPKVKKWILKMTSKTIEESWSIVTGATGNVLGDIISKFYGFNY